MTTTTTSDAPPPLIQPSSPSSASSSDADLPASPPLLPADQPVPSVIIQSASPPISSPASLSPAPNDLPASGRKPHSPVRPIERNKRRDTVHDLSAFKLEQGRGTSSLDEGARKSTLTAPTKSSTTTTRPSRHPRRASTGGAMVGAAARKSIAMMEPSQPAKSSIEAKVVIIGQAGVGKTSCAPSSAFLRWDRRV